MRNTSCRLLILCLLFLGSCRDTPEKVKDILPLANQETFDGTTRMKERLQLLGAKTVLHYFPDKDRSEQLRKDLDRAIRIKTRMKAAVRIAENELRTGSTEAAISVLSKILVEMERKKVDTKSTNRVNKILALAYLRLGEGQNCVDRLNDESCLLPNTEKGIYTLQSAMKKAIQLYQTILATQPDDLESIWLLNFAYMTMGQYPDGVPAEYLVPTSQFESDADIPKFRNIAQETGVGTVALSGSVAFDDFNNDGLIDIVASSWGLDDQIRFFYNNGKGFTEVTNKTGLMGITGGLNINHLDYNNDGFLDIFVLRGAWKGIKGMFPNSLLKNNGDGTFSDVTEEAGLLSFAPTQTAAWADFNLDGHLDVFIGNESKPNEVAFACEFYLNNGDGTFSDKTKEIQVEEWTGFVKGVTAGDLNNDGLPDLYLSYLNEPNRLFINKGINNGIPDFENITTTARVAEPSVSFPTWMWDFDNDGWLDIMVAGYGVDRRANNAGEMMVLNARGKYIGGHPLFYKNKQDLTFVEESEKLGVRDALLVMGSNFADINNDGFLDAYYGTGAPKFSSIAPNKMYLNHKGEKFYDVTTAGGFGHAQKGHGVGFADVDNDGDQDVFCVLGGAYENDIFSDALFLNPYGNQLNWVTLRLEGTTANRAAIGAKVQVIVTTKTGQKQNIYRWVNQGGSFGGNSLQLEIGLGDIEKIDKITVTWPNTAQSQSVFKAVTMEKFYLVKEGATSLVELDNKVLDF